MQRKSRRLKCRHCGKLVSRKSKNKYFCSVKCMKTAVKENYPSKPPEQEVSIGGKPYAISEDGIRELISAQDVADYEKSVLDDAIKIPYDRELTGDAQDDMMKDLVDFGRCASETTPEGIRRIDPVSDEMAVLLHNAGHPDSPIVTEDLTLEEFRKKYPDVVGSEWQGDPPEGTLAFKLKYGEWWKKDLK